MVRGLGKREEGGKRGEMGMYRRWRLKGVIKDFFLSSSSFGTLYV